MEHRCSTPFKDLNFDLIFFFFYKGKLKIQEGKLELKNQATVTFSTKDNICYLYEYYFRNGHK